MSNNSSSSPTESGAGTGWAVSVDEGLVKYVCQGFYVLVVVIGLPGNGISIYLLAANKKLRDAVGSIATLMLSLSVIDLLTCSMMIPFYIFREQTFPLLQHPVWCRAIVSTYFFWGMAATSAYHLTFISVDRYVAICHPVWHKTRWNRGEVSALAILLAFVIGFGVSFSWIVFTYHFRDGECVFNEQFFEERWRRFEGWYQATVDLLIPTAVMGTLYCRIYAHLRHRAKHRPCPPAQSRSIERGMRAVLRTMIVTGATYVVCVAPNKIQWWLHCTGIYEFEFSHWPTFATHVLVCLNSCANPIIYTFSIDSFKQELHRLLPLAARLPIPLERVPGNTLTETRT